MVTSLVTNKKDRSHSVNILFVPGDGFYVSVKIDGETAQVPDSFLSLEHAASFAARQMAKLGYTVELAE